MKKKSCLEPGMAKLIRISTNQKDKVIGVGLLKECVKISPPYIIDEMTEREQEVWQKEKWKTEILSLTEYGETFIHEEHPLEFWFPAMCFVGIKSSGFYLNEKEIEQDVD